MGLDRGHLRRLDSASITDPQSVAMHPSPRNRPGRREALSAALEARNIVRDRRRQIESTSSWIVVQTDWEERLEAERETWREAIWPTTHQPVPMIIRARTVSRGTRFFMARRAPGWWPVPVRPVSPGSSG